MATTVVTLGLPPLREEIGLHAGPAAPDGSPTWILRDPARNRFFSLGWAAFQILSRWDAGSVAAVVAAVNAETTLHIDPDDVQAVIAFLAQNQLLAGAGPEHTQALLAQAEAARLSPWRWLLHHYLFFRIPLVRPNRFLGATLPWVRFLGGRRFRLATLAALVVGLILLARQWSDFVATMPSAATAPVLAAFASALVFTKLCHELAHAYTARHFGCKVGTMGVAFLVMWPVLYTDVNEAWLLADRRRRLWVGAAGVAAELTLAAWASLAWSLLPDGALRQSAFVLAATTWITSLVVNLSPFMRFDGYFLLMDRLNLPNLHRRAFALAQVHLRRLLFGLDEPDPEPFPPRTRMALIIFAWAVWIYRLVLFLGIALLVYHFFIKAVGIFLFLVEIVWFVATPIWREVRSWHERRRAIVASRRTWWSAALILLGLGLGLVPLPMRIIAPAVLKGGQMVGVFAPQPAQLTEILAANGAEVAAGTVLFRFISPELEHRLDEAERKIAVLERQLAGSGFDLTLQQQIQALREALQAARVEWRAAAAERDALSVRAPISGRVVDLSPELTPGQMLNPRDQLAALVGTAPARVEAYVAEEDLGRLEDGATAVFIAAGQPAAGLPLRVDEIEMAPAARIDAAVLTSAGGGPIPVSRKGGVEKGQFYKVGLAAMQAPPGQQQAGRVAIDGHWQSLAGRFWRAALAVLIRESGA